MYTLFGTANSGATAVEAALLMAGAPYRTVAGASWKPGPELEELRRVNPLAQVPTLLTPDGTVLTESAAILIHLGEVFPDSGLLPRDILRRAQVIRGLVFIAANCYAAIGIIDYPERWCLDTDDGLKARIRAATMARLHGFWDLFADAFPATPFLNGETPGALDLLAAVVSKWSGARDHLRSSRPGFHRLLLRIDAAPPAAPVLARQVPE